MSNAFREVLSVRNSDLPLPDQVTISGADPVLSTRFRIGETCAAVLAGIGVAVSVIWAQRTGRRQNRRLPGLSRKSLEKMGLEVIVEVLMKMMAVILRCWIWSGTRSRKAT